MASRDIFSVNRMPIFFKTRPSLGTFTRAGTDVGEIMIKDIPKPTAS